MLPEDHLLVDQLDDRRGPPGQPRPAIEVGAQRPRRARIPVADQLVEQGLQLGVERVAVVPGDARTVVSLIVGSLHPQGVQDPPGGAVERLADRVGALAQPLADLLPGQPLLPQLGDRPLAVGQELIGLLDQLAQRELAGGPRARRGDGSTPSDPSPPTGIVGRRNSGCRARSMTRLAAIRASSRFIASVSATSYRPTAEPTRNPASTTWQRSEESLARRSPRAQPGPDDPTDVRLVGAEELRRRILIPGPNPLEQLLQPAHATRPGDLRRCRRLETGSIAPLRLTDQRHVSIGPVPIRLRAPSRAGPGGSSRGRDRRRPSSSSRTDPCGHARRGRTAPNGSHHLIDFKGISATSTRDHRVHIPDRRPVNADRLRDGHPAPGRCGGDPGAGRIRSPSIRPILLGYARLGRGSPAVWPGPQRRRILGAGWRSRSSVGIQCEGVATTSGSATGK